MAIDLEEVKATLRNHRERLQEEIASTERAIEMLDRLHLPCLFSMDAEGI
jgi:hypothetical protein